MTSRILVLGSLPLEYRGARVGIQEIAQRLSERGHAVDYVANPISLPDFYFRSRRPRIVEAWRDRVDVRPRVLSGTLRQFTFKTLIPPEKKYWKSSLQIPLYPLISPRWLGRETYDFCIHDTSFPALFLPRVRARNLIYRLNDHPEAFADRISPHVIGFFRRQIRRGRYREIWAVSRSLVRYAASLNGTTPILHLPNGADSTVIVVPRQSAPSRRAIYVGTFEEYFDFELLEKTASLLPDWTFDLYGAGASLHTHSFSAPNIVLHAPVFHEEIPSILARGSVGLIPFQKKPRLDMVERPLKFYNYLAAGLGIASTGHGGLREGMAGLASFGNTPEDYAAAILQAALPYSESQIELSARVLRESSWETLIEAMCHRLADLRQAPRVK